MPVKNVRAGDFRVITSASTITGSQSPALDAGIGLTRDSSSALSIPTWL